MSADPTLQQTAAPAKGGRAGLYSGEESVEVPILMYHSIADDGPEELKPYRLSPARFESQISYLKEHGFHSITLDDWRLAKTEGRRLPGRPVILTFDDGYVNFLTHAWPILERSGLSATVFVVTDKVGTTADWDKVTGDPLPLMGWDDLRYLRDHGICIASHTATHPSLPTLSTEAIVQEGVRSREKLRVSLEVDATSIAFPFGHADERVRSAIGSAGYTLAVNTWGGTSTLVHEPLNLPRIEVFPDDDLPTFSAKIAPLRPRLAPAARPHAVPSFLPFPTIQVNPMAIHPDYAQRLAARLDTLIGEFVSLHSELIAVAGQAASLQHKLAQLFRQPVTGRVQRNLGPYEGLAGGIRVGFEKEARVTLNVEPKSDFGASPENCINTLEFDFVGPSRWLSFEVDFEWAEISAAQHFQLGFYATVSRNTVGRAVLRLPGKDGKPLDHVLGNYELLTERRNVNKSGPLNMPDFVTIDTGKRPTLLFFLEMQNSPTLRLKLDYLCLYFD
jgi:peptidoglycan/xylan/chitin deacetylase (PgdA/CDA1 family)